MQVSTICYRTVSNTTHGSKIHSNTTFYKEERSRKKGKGTMKVFKVLVVHVQTVTLSASQSSYVYYPIISSSVKWLVDCLVG